MVSVRTDLAVEAKEMADGSLSGVREEKRVEDGAEITWVSVETEEAARALQKPVGHYVTIETGGLREKDAKDMAFLSRILSTELSKMFSVSPQDSVLVIGLGNREITPDSVGPKTASNVLVTRHLLEYIPGSMDKRLHRVSALVPGVLGTTGIETGEIIKGLAEKTAPTLIIAIDALVSLHAERVAATIQITDTGIHPGSGVGNHRKALTEESMGVPVIAIGIPTILDAGGFLKETLHLLLSEDKNLSDTKKDSLLKRLPLRSEASFFVTPKDIDELSDKAARILSLGLDLFLHRDMTEEELSIYR